MHGSSCRPVSPALFLTAVALMAAFYFEAVYIRLSVPLASEERLELWAIAAFVFCAVGALAAMGALVDARRVTATITPGRDADDEAAR